MNIVGRYCLLLENSNKKTDIELLQEAFILLLHLSLSAAQLPEIHRLSNYELTTMPYDQYHSLRLSLSTKLTGHDLFTEVFDPWDNQNKAAIPMTLSDCLAGIYADLKPGMQDWENITASQKLNVIWERKFSFGCHWGWHAAEASKALFWLLYHHNKDEKTMSASNGLEEF